MKKYSFLKSYISGEAAFGYTGVVGKAIGILNSFIILFSLTLYQFGVYQLLLASIGLVGIFLFPGLNNVVLNDIIRFESEGKRDRAKRLFSEYAFFRVANGIILSVLVFASSFFVARFYSGDMVFYVQVLSGMFFINSVSSILRVFLRSKLQFNLLALEQTGRELVKLFFIVGFLVFSHITIATILIAHVSAPIIMLTVFFFLMWPGLRKMSARTTAPSVLWWVVRHHGKWSLVQGYAKEIGERIRPWLIKVFISTEAVSIFTVALNLVDLIQNFLPANVLGSLLPRELQDRTKLRRIVVHGTKYLMAIGLVFAIAGIIILPPLVLLVLPHYEASLAFFIPLTLVLPLYGMGKLSGALLMSHRKQRVMTIRPFLGIIIPVVFSFLVYPRWGVWGAVFVFLLDYSVATTLFWFLVFKYFPDMRFSFKEMVRFTREDWDFFKRAFQETKELIQLKLFGVRRGDT